ncbi:hypothetical protein ACF0H5_022799 [Mactra antiquata]
MAGIYTNGLYSVGIIVIFCCILLEVCACYIVKVVTHGDDCIKHTEHYKIVDEEVPPFSLQVDEHSDGHLDGQYGNSWSKQSVTQTAVTADKRHRRSADVIPSRCLNSEDVSRILIVDVGEDIYLPCHRCGAKRKDMYKSKQWLKLDMFPSSEGLYHIQEVDIDIHDDDRLNRVLTFLDHTLVIRNAQATDTGSYFCKQTGQSDKFLNLRLKWVELSDFLSKESGIREHYHVDVVDLDHSEFVDTSEHSDTKPLKSEIMSELNVRVVTQWNPWSDCEVCDVTGIRKRIGLCYVKKLDQNKRVPNDHLERILSLSLDGIPCQSELLGDFPHESWTLRSNEVQLSDCFEPCKKSAKHRSKRGIPLFMSKLKDKKKDENKNKTASNEVTKKIKVGAYFILKCPDVKLKYNVLWVNGTKLVDVKDIIRERTTTTTIDMFGSLHFKKASLTDNGVYTCWFKGSLRHKFVVVVEEDVQVIVKQYTHYLLYSFVGDFFVFIILAIIKYINRSVQRRRPRKPKSASPDVRDDNNDSETMQSSDISSSASSSSNERG